MPIHDWNRVDANLFHHFHEAWTVTIRNALNSALPAAMRADVKQTIINAGPDNLTEVLLQCIDDRDFLLDRGKASLEYVHRWHHPDYVAGLTKERYEMAAA